ncbi:RNA polymerase sporulation sigma factor SigE [Anaerofustis stercorihominis]|uniref:RNA polymerase sigma factor n=2 Tax=Anaerofustis stercorihominis TaxID=214853 RepID=A0A3E3DZN2_9FIRM|nr:RNA polymerase sporulation sigma factor SigE [Anaerofustis stercorihominis]MCQ4794380.1 RNA polymerase sporulation sigma factor SigE [Anaerofustis stercorihominis]RGD74389.1 RNA polymerase sporulation sigma factor SigE [Anaerofustis stercorihominis]
MINLFNILKRKKHKKNKLFYISGSYMLPPPLTKEEEQEVLKNLESDETNATKTILIERNLRLVVYIAKKFDTSSASVEDLISIGTIGLIKAVKTFKVEKNIKLATYASKCIENEILMHLRKVNRIRGEISLDEPLNVDYDGNELLLSDILGTNGDPVKDKIDKDVNKEIMLLAVDRLKESEKEIINYRFGLNGKEKKTQKELANMLNISQSYISRLEKRIISNLKKEVNKMCT